MSSAFCRRAEPHHGCIDCEVTWEKHTRMYWEIMSQKWLWRGFQLHPQRWLIARRVRRNSGRDSEGERQKWRLTKIKNDGCREGWMDGRKKSKLEAECHKIGSWRERWNHNSCSEFNVRVVILKQWFSTLLTLGGLFLKFCLHRDEWRWRCNFRLPQVWQIQHLSDVLVTFIWIRINQSNFYQISEWCYDFRKILTKSVKLQGYQSVHSGITTFGGWTWPQVQCRGQSKTTPKAAHVLSCSCHYW